MSKVIYDGDYRGQDVLLETLRKRVLKITNPENNDWEKTWNEEANSFSKEMLEEGLIKNSEYILKLKT